MKNTGFSMSIPTKDIRNNKIDTTELAVMFILMKYRGANDVALMTVGAIAEKMGCDSNPQISVTDICRITKTLTRLIEKGILKLNPSIEQIDRISQIFEYSIKDCKPATNQIVKLNEEEFEEIFVKSSERNRTSLLYTYLYVKSFYIQCVPKFDCEIKHVLVDTNNLMARKMKMQSSALLGQLNSLCESGWLQRYEPTESWKGAEKDCPYLYIPSYLVGFKDRCLELAKNKILFS